MTVLKIIGAVLGTVCVLAAVVAVSALRIAKSINEDET
jgi:hypothetical protein